MKFRNIVLAGLFAFVAAACTPEDEQILDYCSGVSDASLSIIKMRDSGMDKSAVINLLKHSEIGKDKVLLNHVIRNINFAYQYPGMPENIYKREILNHCISTS